MNNNEQKVTTIKITFKDIILILLLACFLYVVIFSILPLPIRKNTEQEAFKQNKQQTQSSYDQKQSH